MWSPQRDSFQQMLDHPSPESHDGHVDNNGSEPAAASAEDPRTLPPPTTRGSLSRRGRLARFLDARSRPARITPPMPPAPEPREYARLTAASARQRERFLALRRSIDRANQRLQAPTPPSMGSSGPSRDVPWTFGESSSNSRAPSRHNGPNSTVSNDVSRFREVTRVSGRPTISTP